MAHRLARVLWTILHDGVRYIEKDTETTPQAKKRRAQKMLKALRELGPKTRGDYLLRLRRLLADLAANGHPVPPDLIRREDFPPRPQYLPRPLSPDDDQRLQQELRRTDDLPANALLLTRLTGLRIGECIDRPLDCAHWLCRHDWRNQKDYCCRDGPVITLCTGHFSGL